jgi:autotransporter-associated beta strand protein
MLGGILTNDDTLKIDLTTKKITVTNTNASGLFTGGFGYVNAADFSGTINSTGDKTTTAPEYSVSAKGGNAYGFLFAKDAAGADGLANLSGATINLEKTKISVTNSGVLASGFVVGHLTSNLVGTHSTITLGEIISTADTGNTNTWAEGFVGGKVGTDSKITIGNITVESKGTGTGSGAIGFKVLGIEKNATVELGDIKVKDAGDGITDGVLIGQNIGKKSDQPLASVLGGTFSVGKIEVESTSNGGRSSGFSIRNEDSGTVAITGQVTFKDNISVSSVERAIGITIGTYGDEGPRVSANANTIDIQGDITAKSTQGHAVGIFAGQLKGLNVSTKISAEITTANDSVDHAEGIFTRGYLLTNGDPENSTITIKDGASIFATKTVSPTSPVAASSIRMESKDKDVVNIDAGSLLTTAWTNSDGATKQAFTLRGVEELNVLENSFVDLSETTADSLRGRVSSGSVNDAKTNVIGSLKVKDTFFNSGSGKSNVNVAGTLDVVTTETSANLSGGIIDTLTINSGGEVELGDYAELEFVSPTGAITITDGTLKITDTAGIFTTDQKTEYPKTNGDLSTGQLEATVTRGTIEVVGNTQSLFAVGLETTVVEKATINVASDAEISIGNVTKSGDSADLIKDGAGIMTIDHNINGGQKWSSQIDLGTGTLDIKTGTVQVLQDVEIKANINVAENATFKTAGESAKVDVQINALTGAGEVNLRSNDTLLVKSGTFDGKIIDSGNLTKNDSGTLTLSGENTYSGETKIDAGTLALSVSGTIKESSKVTIANGATFNISNLTSGSTALVKELSGSTNAEIVLGGNSLSVEEGSFAGKIIGTGGLTKITDETLTLSGANTYEGETKINAGNLNLTGAGSIAASSGVNFTGAGTFDISNLTGTDTTIKALNSTTSGTVALSTDKELKVTGGSFAGTITGTGTFTKENSNTLTLTNNEPFTHTSTVKITGGTLQLDRANHLDSSGYQFDQNLTGSGTLEVGLKEEDTKFSFGDNVGAAFTGTVSLTKGIIELDTDNNKNDNVLANATLKLATTSTVDVKSDTTIKNLTTDGGTVKFHTTEISPNAKLTVTNLNVSGDNVTTINLANGITNGINTTALVEQNLFDYSTAESNYQRLLIEATSVNGNDNNIELVPPVGAAAAAKSRNLYNGDTSNADNKVGEATFDYKASVNVLPDKAKGIYLGYGLTEIKADDGKSVKLDAEGADRELYATLTGDGGFDFTGDTTKSVTIYSKNSYKGETTITAPDAGTFTVKAATDNAFGETSNLDVGTGVTVDFQTHSQTVKGLAGSGTITDGTLTVNTEAIDSTFGGILTGTTALTKKGNGHSLTLSGKNTYSGETTVEAGTLILSGTIDETSGITVATGATLDVKGEKTLNNLASEGTVTFDNKLTLAGNANTEITGLKGTGLDGTGDVTKTGTGTTTLSGTNDIGKSNTFTQAAGSVELDGTLIGNYVQKEDAGMFSTTPNAEIDGTAQFTKKTNFIVPLTIKGQSSFDEDVIFNDTFDTGGIDAKKNMTVNEAKVTSNGNVEVDQDLTLNDATLNVTKGNLTVGKEYSDTADSKVNVAGEFTFTSPLTIKSTDFTVGTLDVANEQTVTLNPNAVVKGNDTNNAGRLILHAGSEFGAEGKFLENTGTITAFDGGNSIVKSTITGEGGTVWIGDPDSPDIDGAELNATGDWNATNSTVNFAVDSQGNVGQLNITGQATGDSTVNLNGKIANRNKLGQKVSENPHNLITAAATSDINAFKLGTDNDSLQNNTNSWKFFLTGKNNNGTNTIWELTAESEAVVPDVSGFFLTNIIGFDLPRAQNISGPWVRIKGGSVNDDKAQLNDTSYQLIQIGWDKSFKAVYGGNWYAGIFMEGDWMYGNGNYYRDRNVPGVNPWLAGSLKSSHRGAGAGLYVSRGFKNNWYIDLLGRINTFESQIDMTGRSASKNHPETASYNGKWTDSIFAFAIEVGKTFDSQNKRWSFAPYNRLLYYSTPSSNYLLQITGDDPQALNVRSHAADTWTNQLGTRLYYTSRLNGKDFGNIFVGADYYKGFAGKFATDVTAMGSNKWKPMNLGRSKNNLSYGTTTLGTAIFPTESFTISAQADFMFGDVSGSAVTLSGRYSY